MAGGESPNQKGDLVDSIQESHEEAVHQVSRRGRRGDVLRLDRIHWVQRLGCGTLRHALHAAQGEVKMVREKQGARKKIDRRREDDACGEGDASERCEMMQNLTRTGMNPRATPTKPTKLGSGASPL